MKQNTATKGTVVLYGLVLILIALLTALTTAFAAAQPAQKQVSNGSAVASDKAVVDDFNKRVKGYVKQRETVRNRLPNLSKDSTPEQIQAHEKAFADGVRSARAAAKPADLLTPAMADHIRATIRAEYKGKERQEVREEILAADTTGVPLQVNHPYPDSKELSEIPATLLLRLPQLPKQVKYRFARRNLLLVDTDNALIIDFMTNAVP